MLKEMTQPFILRRTKQQVLADLPEKTEDVHYVTLNEGEQAVYEEMRRMVELKFKKGKTKAEWIEAREIDVSYFEELMKLSNELTEEEKRYVREGFENDEQLSMYDVLMKDNLSKDDIKKLKTVAKELLEKIKALLATMDHPFDKQETKAAIIITIRDILWQELPESYSEENITQYRDAVYNYVSQHYGGVA
jgi:SNF2 family DNA or RNA helicase